MSVVFAKKDIEKITKVLQVSPKWIGNKYRYLLHNPETKQHLSLEIYPEIRIGDRKGNLISIYTANSHLQLHFCTGYVVSEMLGEVTFIAESGDAIAGMIVERGAGCSFYANVPSKLLSGDFTKLGPEVMMSGIALSVAEEVLAAKSKPNR